MTEPNSQVPKSIGIIMDGNRRWAKGQGLPSIEGHRAGAKKLEEAGEWAREKGIEYVIVYAFSTENWKREESEVSKIMELLDEYLQYGFKKFSKSVNMKFIGERERFSERLQKQMEELENAAVEGRPTLVVALSYGGRAEILEGVRKLSAEGKEITEENFSNGLYTAGIPDPDLIIRTGGEQRLSNFLPWQSVYSELIFTDTLWPAYTKEEFEKHLALFGDRKRNFGA
jgi:undecaprenyl diphosphate synthase